MESWCSNPSGRKCVARRVVAPPPMEGYTLANALLDQLDQLIDSPALINLYPLIDNS